LVIDIDLGINATFPVPLLHTQHFPDQGSLVGGAVLVTLLAAGTVLRPFSIIHGRAPQACAAGQQPIGTIVAPERAVRNFKTCLPVTVAALRCRPETGTSAATRSWE
jgi:hypothetical protein